MPVYVARRLLQALFVCLGISVITFLLLHVAGDPVLLLLPQSASDADVALLKQKLGLDRPLVVQYLAFLGDALRGDFGQSLFTQESAFSLILERMPATLELTLAGTLVGLAVAIPLGVLAAIKRGSFLDRLSTVGAVGGQAMPIFWLGIMLIILFAVKLRVLPASGRGTLAHLILPAITLGVYLEPLTMRLTRSGLLVGAIVTETVFAWPGVASLAVKAIRTYDYPVVQGSVVFLALLIVLVNLLTDVAVAWIDPRIRLGADRD